MSARETGSDQTSETSILKSESNPPTLEASKHVLADLARGLIERGERRILGIAGSPGTGKSTLCTALLEELGTIAVVVGMDGFHLANRELVRLGRRNRKGAPDTFDVAGYISLLHRLRNQNDGIIYAPLFDRGIEESIANAIPIDATTPLVIAEGNYLLHSTDGWANVRAMLDQVWFLDVDPDVREKRLIARRQLSGESLAESVAWVRNVDRANATVVESTRSQADLIVRVIDDLEH